MSKNFFVNKWKRLFEADTPTNEKVFTIGFTVVGLVVTGLVVRKVTKTIRDRITASNFGQDMPTQIALSFHKAMNPVGLWGAGTDEDEIMLQAKNMKDNNIDFGDVSRAYRRKYSSDLLTDLEGDLNPEEFSKLQFRMGITDTYQGLEKTNNDILELIDGQIGKTKLTSSEYTLLAKKLHEDLSETFGTTDLDLYKELLRASPVSTFNVAVTYKKNYGSELVSDVMKKGFWTTKGKLIKTLFKIQVPKRIKYVREQKAKQTEN